MSATDPAAPQKFWQRIDVQVRSVLALAAFAGLVTAGARGCSSIVSAEQLAGVVSRQATIDAEQGADLDLLFQTQVRLVTSVESLQHEVREVRLDLRALDSGRRLTPLPPPDEPTSEP